MGREQQWCILRTRGSNTLRLASALDLLGIPSWTPIEIQLRSKSKRSAAEVMVSVMPTYVFASAEYLTDLFALASSPVSAAPSFSVFKYRDRVPLVADGQLASLKRIEREAAAKRQPVRFTNGATVRTPDGPFQGLTGQVIENTRGEFTLVAFPGFTIPVKFASWKLEEAA